MDEPSGSISASALGSYSPAPPDLGRRWGSPRPRASIVLAIAAVAAALVFVPPALMQPAMATGLTATPRGLAPGSHFVYEGLVPNPSTVPISHVVIVMMENHVFDNYFGTYCTTTSTTCAYVPNGLPPGTCIPKDPAHPKNGCIKPYAFANDTPMTGDMQHNWISGVKAYDNGHMDGFYAAEHFDPHTFGYYTGQLIPQYWDLAEQYGLGDNFFASTLSYSLPNHWHLLAGAAPPASEDNLLKSPGTKTLSGPQEQYLNQSNATTAIDDLLVNSSVSWDYFDAPLKATYHAAINDHAGGGGAFAYWNALAGKAESYQTKFSSHFVDRSAFFKDASTGKLPNVSWIIPSAADSEHPPNNVTPGLRFVMNVTNAIESSSEWNSTALFVVWDDYGGFYDHVAPPQTSNFPPFGLSFRSPILVVSPYTPQGYLSSHFGYFESLLRFVEWRFGFKNLTQNDSAAPLPLEYFDFNASPRAPLQVGTGTWSSYPVSLQPLPAPPAPTNVRLSVGVGSATLSWNSPTGGTAPAWYKIIYHPGGNTTNSTTVRVDQALTSFTVSGLPSGTVYWFSIQSETGANQSAAVSVHGTTMAPFGSALLQSRVGQLSVILGLSAPAARWIDGAHRREPVPSERAPTVTAR
ncbi:MAG: fibronectin type III domain-containing protein [Thermoplasmata archaeon]|nr:fibronectin type III domain-containing protein [Thermoplasmata archaeon]